MTTEEKFDVIVVGAGPAGLGASYLLSKEGFNVLVIERGERVGAKNVYGGRIYAHAFHEVFKEGLKEAPIERWIRKERFTVMTDDRALTIDYLMSNVENSFTAYLPAFLRWLAKRVEETGAFILTGVKVDKLIISDNKVSGVLAGGDRFLADVVIDAEGVNPIIAMEAGLRSDWKPSEVALGIKEVIRLPGKVMEERLGLSEGEGLAQLFIGYPTHYLPGGGFLYTNKETITLGVVIKPIYLMENKIKATDLVEDFRQHPYIKSIVKDGSVIEYSAHLIPETGISKGLPKLYGDGLLLVGDAAGFTLNTGFTVRGVDLAFWSGVLAAETVKKAHSEGKYTSEALSYYEELIKQSFIWSELTAHNKIPIILDNERLYSNYPRIITDLMERMYTVDGRPRKLINELMNTLHENISLNMLIRDLITLLFNL